MQNIKILQYLSFIWSSQTIGTPPAEVASSSDRSSLRAKLQNGNKIVPLAGQAELEETEQRKMQERLDELEQRIQCNEKVQKNRLKMQKLRDQANAERSEIVQKLDELKRARQNIAISSPDTREGKLLKSTMLQSNNEAMEALKQKLLEIGKDLKVNLAAIGLDTKIQEVFIGLIYG